MNAQEMTGVVAAWTTASKELGIEVVAPFRFVVGGREHECSAWLAHFGGNKGMVLVGISPPDFETDRQLKADANQEGYKWSALDTRTYSVFDRDTFLEALLDWGFTGPEGRRPPWLEDTEAAKFAVVQAAERASQEHARNHGWRVQQTLVGRDVATLASGHWTVSVTVILQGGAEHYFQYHTAARGIGRLVPIESPRV